MLRISIISPFTSKKIRAFVQRWWWSIVSALPLKPPPAITLPTFIINTHSVQFLFDLVKEKYQVARFVLKQKLIFKNTNFWSCTVASKRMSRTWLSGPHRFFFKFQGVFNQEEYPKCTLLRAMGKSMSPFHAFSNYWFSSDIYSTLGIDIVVPTWKPWHKNN